MKHQPLSLKSLSLAVLLCSAAAAQADITVYTDRTAFLAATAMPGVDTYDDLEVILYTSPLERMAGAYHYRASSGPVSDLYGAGMDGDHWLSTNVRNDSITFSNFSTGVYAVGGNFFGSDISGAFVPGTTMYLSATDGTVTSNATVADSMVNSFLGFVSTTPLTGVTLSNGGGLYWVTANNLTLAAPVPEPSTYGMLLAGMCLLGGLARRRTD